MNMLILFPHLADLQNDKVVDVKIINLLTLVNFTISKYYIRMYCIVNDPEIEKYLYSMDKIEYSPYLEIIEYIGVISNDYTCIIKPNYEEIKKLLNYFIEFIDITNIVNNHELNNSFKNMMF
jgi:hypothetical protein